MTANRASLLVVSIAALLLAGGALLYPVIGSGDEAPEGRSGAARPAAEEPAAEPQGAPRATPPARSEEPEEPGPRGRLVLPDGSRVPALNDVEGEIVLAWPPDVPWSPIVGKEIDPDGQAWYVHRDGSKSTSKNLWRSDLGRAVPATTVANPTDPRPLHPADLEPGEKERRQGKGEKGKKGSGPRVK